MLKMTIAAGAALLLATGHGASAQDAPDADPSATPSQKQPRPPLVDDLPDNVDDYAAPRDNTTPPSVLAIFAHPDDEITVSPVLSRIAREGGTVTIVFATSGDAGPGSSGFEPGQALANLREREALCAALALGLDDPLFWKLGDGTLSTMARAPDSPARQLAGRITDIIAITRPEVIMTWGPDGGYGHADHRMVSAAVTQVVQQMGHDRPELLYTAIPDGSGSELGGFEGWATIHPSLVTDRLRYTPLDLQNASSALDCYESQFSDEIRASLIPMLHESVWRGAVFFRLAFPHTVEPS
ncbi:PIG-L deacetylase family protein [Erythrobacter sp. GH1-10]|uniref:PIG-L deacetylase family protein n=1 Tax=Erythrobacter sp. GH1-10 TaxID=3349334 RepID=UPI003877CEDB